MAAKTTRKRTPAPRPTPQKAAQPASGSPKCIREAQTRSDRRCSQFLIEEFRREAEEFLSFACPSEIAFMASVFSLASGGGDLIGLIFRALNMEADDLIGPVSDQSLTAREESQSE